MGDRSGGREAKGSSLKKSKSNPGSAAALKLKAKSATATRQSLAGLFEGARLIDTAAALASRLFDHDRDRSIKRAVEEGVATVAWTNDMEKLASLADLCRDNSGVVYFACGVHPDNVDRANKKVSDAWIDRVSELACRGECVSILSGLSLARDVSTHFAQETLLRSCAALALKFHVPLTLHLTPCAVERAVEILRAEGVLAGDVRVLAHDAVTAVAGDSSKLQLLLDAGLYASVSAAGLLDSEETSRERVLACIRCIPPNRLLLCSDSPWRTPQNITDTYLRTLRNEPSNLPFVVSAVAEVLGVEAAQLTDSLRVNGESLYGLGAALPAPAAPLPLANTDLVLPLAQDTPSTAAAAAATVYRCRKCRALLFPHSAVVVHEAISGSHAVARKGREEGLCSSNLFLHGAQSVGLMTNRDVVECDECGAKVGRAFETDGSCACGATVQGPILRINAAKVDAAFAIESDEQLAELGRQSQTELELSRLKLDCAEGTGEEGKRRVKRSKIVKERGAGNFSSYRNKSFIPNASRASRVGASLAHGEKAEDDESAEEGSS